MKIKKKGLLLLLLICLPFTNNIFAIDNHQRIQNIDSDIYEGIRDLYFSQSLAMPSTAAPYSDSELIMMLDLLDTSKFNSSDAKLYKYIKNNLSIDDNNSNEYGIIKWGVDFNLEGYIHQNTTDFIRRENFIYSFKDSEPLINIGFESWAGKNFYGLSNFSLGITYSLENVFGGQTLTTNIIALPPNGIFDLDFNMPYRGILAFGGDTWSLSIGRDRVKWGNGESSNFMIGDNFPYLDQLRYTSFTNQFKYTYLLAFFPHPMNYIEDGDSDPTTGLGQGSPVEGTRALIAHRGEGRLFNDKMTIALTESIMYQSETNVLDLRYLSPTAIFHNYYIRANANSLLSAEMDFTPFKNFNIYAQGVVDEFALPGEPVPGVDSSALPNAFGYLFGLRYNYDVLNKYKGKTSLEFAHTDPYLYLRGDGLDNGTQYANEYGINYVVAFREFTNHDARYHSEFLGYKYGGDAIVVNLNSSLKDYGKWTVNANAFYMLHGIFDKYTCWDRVYNTDPTTAYITPTTTTDNESNNNSSSQEPVSDIALRNAVSQTIVLGGSVNYQVNENFNCFVQMDYVNINNYQNISGQKTSDLQLVLSLSYSL